MSLLAYAQELVQREVNDKVLDLPDFVNKPAKQNKPVSGSHNSVDSPDTTKAIEWADQSNLKLATQTIISAITKVKKTTQGKFQPVKADTLLGDIQTLRVINQPVSKFEPALLSRLPRLEGLVLIDNQLTDLSDEQLRNLPPSLQTLTVQAN